MKLKKLASSLLIVSALIILSSSVFAENSPLPAKEAAATVVGDNSVVITWTPPADATVAGFNVYRKDDLSVGGYEKISKQLVTSSTYTDTNLGKGKSYSYTVRSVNTDGAESDRSNIAGAPKMSMNASATVLHMGKPVKIATPGDTIRYDIDFANKGFGLAKNVVIVYAIPKGTTFISGTAKCPKYKVTIGYFDEAAGKWIEKVNKEEDVSKIKFTILEDIFPVSKKTNDTASLKVMVNY